MSKVTLAASLELYGDFAQSMDRASESLVTATARAESFQNIVARDLTPNINEAKIVTATEKMNILIGAQREQENILATLGTRYDVLAEKALAYDRVKNSRNPNVAMSRPEPTSDELKELDQIEQKMTRAEMASIKYTEQINKTAEALARLTQKQASANAATEQASTAAPFTPSVMTSQDSSGWLTGYMRNAERSAGITRRLGESISTVREQASKGVNLNVDVMKLEAAKAKFTELQSTYNSLKSNTQGINNELSQVATKQQEVNAAIQQQSVNLQIAEKAAQRMPHSTEFAEQLQREQAIMSKYFNRLAELDQKTTTLGNSLKEATNKEAIFAAKMATAAQEVNKLKAAIDAKNAAMQADAQQKAVTQTQRVNSALATLTGTQTRYNAVTFRSMTTADMAVRAHERQAQPIGKLAQLYQRLKSAAASAGESLRGRFTEATTEANTLLEKIKNLVVAYAGLRAVKSLVGNIVKVSDEYTSANAQLNVINDGLRTQEALQNQVYAAAQRSYTPYAEMVDMMSNFSMVGGIDNAQSMRISESLQKILKISGGKGGAAFSAQVANALATGDINSRFFNSLIKEAPYMAQVLENTFQKPLSQIKKLADAGKISAGQITNAFISQSALIDEQFNQLPVTFEDLKVSAMNAFTRIGEAMGATGMPLQVLNEKIQEFLTWLETPVGLDFLAIIGSMLNGIILVVSSLFEIVTAGIMWVVGNLDILLPILAGVAIAIGIITVARIAMAAATTIATAAQWLLNSAMLASPLTWIAIIIGIVIGLFIFLAIKIYTARDAFMRFAEGAGNAVGAVAGFIGMIVDNVVGAIFAVINTAIDGINGLIGFVNKIGGKFGFGGFEQIEHLTDNNAGRADRWKANSHDFVIDKAEGLADKVESVGDTVTGVLDSFKGNMTADPYQQQTPPVVDSINDKLSVLPAATTSGGGGGGSGGGSGGKAIRTKDTSKEDTELLKWQQEIGKINAVNYQITLQPQVSISGNEFTTKNEVDPDQLADIIGSRLTQETETMIIKNIEVV